MSLCYDYYYSRFQFTRCIILKSSRNSLILNANLRKLHYLDFGNYHSLSHSLVKRKNNREANRTSYKVSNYILSVGFGQHVS